jgi:hypothetical protein
LLRECVAQDSSHLIHCAVDAAAVTDSLVVEGAVRAHAEPGGAVEFEDFDPPVDIPDSCACRRVAEQVRRFAVSVDSVAESNCKVLPLPAVIVSHWSTDPDVMPWPAGAEAR